VAETWIALVDTEEAFEPSSRVSGFLRIVFMLGRETAEDFDLPPIAFLAMVETRFYAAILFLKDHSRNRLLSFERLEFSIVVQE
jgi:hypothetical protein